MERKVCVAEVDTLNHIFPLEAATWLPGLALVLLDGCLVQVLSHVKWGLLISTQGLLHKMIDGTATKDTLEGVQNWVVSSSAAFLGPRG